MIPRPLSKVCYISADEFPACFHLLTISQYILHNICYKESTANHGGRRGATLLSSTFECFQSGFELHSRYIPPQTYSPGWRLVPPIGTQKQARPTFPERVGRSVAHAKAVQDPSRQVFSIWLRRTWPHIDGSRHTIHYHQYQQRQIG